MVILMVSDDGKLMVSDDGNTDGNTDDNTVPQKHRPFG